MINESKYIEYIGYFAASADFDEFENRDRQSISFYSDRDVAKRHAKNKNGFVLRVKFEMKNPKILHKGLITTAHNSKKDLIDGGYDGYIMKTNNFDVYGIVNSDQIIECL